MSEDSPFRPPDCGRLRRVRSLTLSPDGTRVACVTTTRHDDRTVPTLRVVGVPSGETHQTVVVPISDRPRWSPTGDRLGVVTAALDTDGQQVVVLSPDSGAVEHTTEVDGGVVSFDWAPAGDALVVETAVDPTPAADVRVRTTIDDTRVRTTTDDTRVRTTTDDTRENTGRTHRLSWWPLDPAAEPTPICTVTPPAVGNAAPTPLADAVLYRQGAPAAEGTGLVAETTGDRHRLLDPARGLDVARPVADPDRSKVAVLTTPAADPSARPALWIGDDESARPVAGGGDSDGPSGGGDDPTPAEDLGRISAPRWQSAETVVVRSVREGRTDLVAVDVAGEPPTWRRFADDTTSVASHDAGDGRVVTAVSDDEPVRLRVVAPGEDHDRLFDPNDRLRRQNTSPTRRWLSWETDGRRLDGRLAVPAGSPPFPTVIDLHGGPIDCVDTQFSPMDAVFASAGYAVFRPNYSGSISYGSAVADSANRVDGRPTREVCDVVDVLIDRGVAAPERLFLAGRSYGATVGARVLAERDQFRAAILEHGLYDYRAAYGTTVGQDRLRQLLGDLPGRTTAYDAASPITRAHEVTTPTLLVAGGTDDVTPATQSERLYAALADSGVRSRLVVDSTAGHHIDRPVRVATERLAWVARHDPSRPSG